MTENNKSPAEQTAFLLTEPARRSRRAAGQYGLMTDERDPHDEYETPEGAVYDLVGKVGLVGGIWDPCCGRGNILRALRAHYRRGTMKLVGSELFEQPRCEEANAQDFGSDFMDATALPAGCRDIVMNPPFSKSDDHIRKALELIGEHGKVCVLLRFGWICAKKRAPFVGHLERIVISGRLKMLPPDVPDKGHNGAVDFAWFVFRKQPIPRWMSTEPLIVHAGV